ncbi:putative repressor [Leadbettera azotonutricia ZAS-9]|uniref:Putative repressor n=2 Tax=Leadbettera azotonutricia TaxID=150829 RepID=F5YDN7_LEAAZ|nr:putative repressor [Leadbettera azotonutricia ZAS-9]
MFAEMFWGRVKRLIEKNGMTQKEAAKASGLSYNTMRGWMYKGIIPIAVDAYKIAQALGVTVEYLVAGKNPRKSQADDIIKKACSLLREAEEKLGSIVT